jgi:hypothetical protein
LYIRSFPGQAFQQENKTTTQHSLTLKVIDETAEGGMLREEVGKAEWMGAGVFVNANQEGG